MGSFLRFLAHVGKAFGISSPADNAKRSASRKQKQEVSQATGSEGSGPTPAR